MVDLTEPLAQAQAELAQARAHIAQLEAQLARTADERYRLLADSIPDALYVLEMAADDRPLRIIEVNERACQTLGYSRAELLQLTLAEIDAPMPLAQRQALVAQLQAGEQVTFEQTHIARDGRPIPVEVHAHMGVLQGKRVVISLAHDISRRKLVEQDLQRFAAIVQQTDDAVVITDAPPVGEPTILFANDAFTRITGYSLAEAIDQKINILQLPGMQIADRAEFAELHAVLRRGEVYRGKTVSYHKQGTPLVLQWSITPIAGSQHTITNFAAVIRDVTAQERQIEQLRAMQRDLQASQAHLSGILDTMEDALLSLSLPDRQLLYVTASFERVFGYPVAAFLADPLFFKQIVHPDDLAAALTAMDQALCTGFVEFEHRIILPDGQIRWLHRRAWVNRNVQGKPLRVNDSARDITERKHAEAALRQSETYLRSLIDSQTAFNLRVDMAGQIVYANDRYYQEFGWVAPSLIGRSALETILPEDHEKLSMVAMQCLRQVGVPVQVELRKPKQHGGFFWTLWEFIAVGEKDGTINEIQCVGFDITQQKQSEADLRASEQRYRQMFEMHQLPKLIVDPDNGCIVDANPAAAAFYGYAVEVLKTRSIFDLNLSPSSEVMAKMAKASASSIVACEFVHRGAGGQPRNVEVFTGPVDNDGRRLLYSIITDTTEKQRAKLALQEAHDLLEQRVIQRTAELEKVKNRLEAIFNHSADAILLLDVTAGIQQANHAFETLWGETTDHYVGAQLSTFVQSDCALDLDAVIADVVHAHQTHQIEARAVRADGATFDIELSIAPVNRSTAAVVNLVCIIRDITEHKKAELAIAEERNLLRTVIDAVPDFIYVKDTDHRIILNNVAHARSLGFETPLAAVGSAGSHLFSPAMAAKFYADEERIFQSGLAILAIEERTLAQDGHEIWALTTKVPLHNTKKELIGLVGITHDISQLKVTEEALRYHEQQLRESQKMLQLVLDTIPASVFWKDRDSVYLGCNRRFAEEAGLARTRDIIGLNDTQLPWLASEAATFRADDRAVMTSATPKLAYEETLFTAAGCQRHIQTNKLPLLNEENQVIGVLGAYSDITERKAAEEALRTSEEKFREFIESAPIATVITDAAGAIVLVNRQAERLLGYTRQELLGQSVDLLVPEQVRSRHTQHRARYFEMPERRRTAVVELTAQRKDGVVFPIDLQLSYIHTRSAPLVMSFILDITERKQAEETLKLALAQEKELGELKSRFVSMASHEFRTPLTTILATADTLSHYRHTMESAQVDLRLNKIRQQVIHMRDIINDVLQLARADARRLAFHPAPGDLDQLCQDIVEEFSSQPHHQGRLQYACVTAPVLAEFDSGLMRQVISNLVSNALKYSPKATTVVVDLSQMADAVTLSVRDQGIGIPESDLHHLFEPFHRAANVGAISGTGLGLSIAKQAVELHGGAIVATSEVGGGATFTITIPKQAAAALAQLAAAAPSR